MDSDIGIGLPPVPELHIVKIQHDGVHTQKTALSFFCLAIKPNLITVKESKVGFDIEANSFQRF